MVRMWSSEPRCGPWTCRAVWEWRAQRSFSCCFIICHLMLWEDVIDQTEATQVSGICNHSTYPGIKWLLCEGCWAFGWSQQRGCCQAVVFAILSLLLHQLTAWKHLYFQQGTFPSEWNFCCATNQNSAGIGRRMVLFSGLQLCCAQGTFSVSLPCYLIHWVYTEVSASITFNLTIAQRVLPTLRLPHCPFWSYFIVKVKYLSRRKDCSPLFSQQNTHYLLQ